MSNKVYAVRKGLKTGIFTNWQECQAYVNGVSGAEYKSFSNEFDAREYLNDALIQNKDESKNTTNKTNNCKNEQELSVMEAYVDGSYNGEHYGSGVVIVGGGEYSFFGNKELYMKEDQIAGEVSAAIFAIMIAILQSKDRVVIYYDYNGIEKWATREWKIKSNVAKAYVEKLSDLKEYIDIDFVKVPAHSNVKNNNRADRLTRKAKFKYEVL